MTDKQTPPEWVLIEAGSFFYDNERLFRVFCDMIERHEPPPSPNRSKGCAMDRDELLALAERVEALSGPDREVDAAIYQALNPHMTPIPEQVGRFYDATRTNARIAGKYYLASGATGAAERWTGSIDAASDLVPERYKRHITMVISPASIDMGRRDYHAYLGGHARKGRAQSFALALTAAALRALAAQQPSGAMTGE